MVPTSLYDDEPTDRVLYTDLDSTWRASKPMLEKNAVRTVDIYGRILQRLELLAEAQRVEALSARLQKYLERLNAEVQLRAHLQKDVEKLNAEVQLEVQLRTHLQTRVEQLEKTLRKRMERENGDLRKSVERMDIENGQLRARLTKLEGAIYASGAVDRLLANPFEEWQGPAEYGADPPHNRAAVVAIGPLPWIPKRSTLDVQVLGFLITANVDLPLYRDMRILGLVDRSYVLLELPSPDLARHFRDAWMSRGPRT